MIKMYVLLRYFRFDMNSAQKKNSSKMFPWNFHKKLLLHINSLTLAYYIIFCCNYRLLCRHRSIAVSGLWLVIFGVFFADIEWFIFYEIFHLKFFTQFFVSKVLFSILRHKVCFSILALKSFLFNFCIKGVPFYTKNGKI